MLILSNRQLNRLSRVDLSVTLTISEAAIISAFPEPTGVLEWDTSRSVEDLCRVEDFVWRNSEHWYLQEDLM